MKKHYFVEGSPDGLCGSCDESKDSERHFGAYVDEFRKPDDAPEGGDDDQDGEGDEGDNAEGDGEDESDAEGDGQADGEGDEGGSDSEAESESPEQQEPERMVSVWGKPHDRDGTCDEDGCVPIEDGIAMVSPGGIFHLRDKPPFHERNSCDEMECLVFTDE